MSQEIDDFNNLVASLIVNKNTKASITRANMQTVLSSLAAIVNSKLDTNSQFAFGGTATQNTDPGIPVASWYEALPGTTYPHFKDITGTPITIAAMVGGELVIRAYISVQGAVSTKVEITADIAATIDTAVAGKLGKTDLTVKIGKNLFDKTTIVAGTINENGIFVLNAGYFITDFIALSPASQYVLSGRVTDNFYNNHIGFYDINKVWISNVNNILNGTFTTPANTAFTRFNVIGANGNGGVDAVQLEVGTDATAYVAFEQTIVGVTGNKVAAGALLVDNVLIPAELFLSGANVIASPNKNLFDKTNIKAGAINENGIFVLNAGYFITDFIALSPASQYVLSGRVTDNFYNNHIGFYDINKVWISNVNNILNGTFTTPANTAFIRFNLIGSGGLGNIDTVQLETGTKGSAYEAYNKTVTNIAGNGVAATSLVVGGLNKSIAQFLDDSDFAYQTDVSYNNDIHNYGFNWPPSVDQFGNYAYSDFYSIVAAQTYILPENNAYLNGLGIVKSLQYALNQARTGSFIYKYPKVLTPGIYVHIAYHVVIPDISIINIPSTILMLDLNQTPDSVPCLYPPAITQVAPGVWEVRKVAIIPNNGKDHQVIGFSMDATIDGSLPAIHFAGFYSYVSSNISKVTTGKRPLLYQSALSASSPWKNKKILILGTSIQANFTGVANDLKNSYANQAADRLGAYIVNNAITGSSVRSANYDGSEMANGGGAFTRTIAQYQAHYPGTGFENASYQNLLDPHLDADLFILSWCYNDYTRDGEKNNQANFATPSADLFDVNTFIGAFNWTIRYILQHNPRARIMIEGHYENQERPLMAQAQTWIANYWQLPINKAWEKTGWGSKLIPGTVSVLNPGQPMNQKEAWMPLDGIHPGSDLTGQATSLLADLLTAFIQSI